MRKMLLIWTMLLVCCTVQFSMAVEKVTIQNKASLLGLANSLGTLKSLKGESFLTTDDLIADIKAEAESDPWLKKYTSNALDIVNRLRYWHNQSGEYSYKKEHLYPKTVVTLPVTMFKHQNQEAMLLTGVVCQDVYNSNRTETKERAQKTYDSYVVPCLKELSTVQFHKDLKFIAVGLMYGNKDFSNDRAKIDFESLVFVVSVKQLKKFSELAIDDEALLKSIECFLLGSDEVNLSKIKLTNK